MYCLTELFEIELFIGTKLNLVLNNLQWLICQTFGLLGILETITNGKKKIIAIGSLKAFCFIFSQLELMKTKINDWLFITNHDTFIRTLYKFIAVTIKTEFFFLFLIQIEPFPSI